MDISIQLGEFLQNYRKSKNITQEGLAELSDVSTAYIGQLERGEKKVSVEVLKKITDALGISLSDFFFLMDSSNEIDTKTLYAIVNLVKEQNSEDQVKILEFIELLLEWKKIRNDQ